MHDLADGSSIAGTQLLQYDEVFAAQVELELEPDLEGVCPVAVDIADGTGDLRVAFGRVRRDVFGGSGAESESLDVFAFQCPRLECVAHGWTKRDGDERWMEECC